MIIQIKRAFQTIVFRIILGLLVFSLILGFLSVRMFKGWQADGPWIVMVNGQEISQEAYDRQLEIEKFRLQTLYQQYGPYAASLMKNLDIKNFAYQNLIRESLLNQVARSLDVHVDPKLALRELTKALPPSLIDESGHIDQHALLSMFPMYKSLAEVEEGMLGGVRRDMVMGMVQSGYYLPLFEVKQHYKAIYDPKKFAIASFILEDFVKKAKEQSVSKKDLQAFYSSESAQNPNYWVAEKRSGTAWEFTADGFGIDINPKMLESYYNKKKRELYIKTPTTIMVRHILFAVPQGASSDQEQKVRAQAQEVLDIIKKDQAQFISLAKKHSDDKATKDKGGLMSVTRKREDHEFDRAAYRLRKDGEISPIVRTPEGFEILQRVSRSQETYKDFKAVENEIRQKLSKERFKGMFERTLGRLLIQGSAQEKAEAVKQLVEQKKPREIQMQDIAQVPTTPLAKKLFSLKTGNFGFYLDEGKDGGIMGVVVQLAGITKKKLKPLESIEKEVEKDYYQSKARKLLAQAVAQLTEQARQKDVSMKSLAHEVGARFEETGWISQDDAASNEEIKRLQIPFYELNSLSDVGMMKEVTVGSDVHIVKVADVRPFDRAAFEAKKDEVARQLLSSERAELEAGFIASLYRNATIIRNKKFNQPLKKQVL